jgi:hypothetical protein
MTAGLLLKMVRFANTFCRQGFVTVQSVSLALLFVQL